MRVAKLLMMAACAFAAVQLYAAAPAMYPNAVKYRDAGGKPATGRSGSAAIEVRALRGQNDTEVEVTTGNFESMATPPGRLDKVQIKIYGGNGDVVVTDNYRRSLMSGGYGAFGYDFPYRGQKIQVQANVSGIDPNRTDIVTVEETVKLRPDLTPTRIDTVSRARVHTSVDIGATIRERNGDVGARANCVLKVDGVQVDQAAGIWVDAGDSVTCAFTYAFHTTGVKQISVEVNQVRPADYDASNNSAFGQIEIVAPGVPVTYSAGAYDITSQYRNDYTSYEEYTYSAPGAISLTVETEGHEERETREAGFSVNMQFADQLWFPVSFAGVVSTAGQTLMSTNAVVEQMFSFSVDGFSGACGEAWESSRRLFVCSSRTVTPDGTFEDTFATIWSHAGTVTFESNIRSLYRLSDGRESVYYFNYSFNEEVGQQPIPRFGNDVTVHVAISDSNVTHDVDVEFALQPFDGAYDWGPLCFSWDWLYDWGRYAGNNCSHQWTRSFGVEGMAEGIDTN